MFPFLSQGVNVTNYFKFLTLFLLVMYKLLVYCWYGQDVINQVRINKRHYVTLHYITLDIVSGFSEYCAVPSCE